MKDITIADPREELRKGRIRIQIKVIVLQHFWHITKHMFSVQPCSLEMIHHGFCLFTVNHPLFFLRNNPCLQIRVGMARRMGWYEPLFFSWSLRDFLNILFSWVLGFLTWVAEGQEKQEVKNICHLRTGPRRCNITSSVFSWWNSHGRELPGSKV